MNRFNSMLLAAAITVAATLSACSTVTSTPAKVADANAAAEAIDALRLGGYVIVMRHGTTESDTADTNPLHLEDCASQRGLTDTGRLMHSGVAKLLAREHVPVGSISASRYCRTVEAAQRMAEPLHVAGLKVTDDFAEGGQVVSPNENKHRAAALRAAAATPPAAGTNTLILTHRPNIMEAFGPDFFGINEGEMAVFRPAGTASGYELVWRVKVADFSAYARLRASRVASATS